MNWDCQGRKFKARCWTVQYNKKGRTRIPSLGNPNEMIKILTILGLYWLSNKSIMGVCDPEASKMIQIVSSGSWFCGHEQCSMMYSLERMELMYYCFGSCLNVYRVNFPTTDSQLQGLLQSHWSTKSSDSKD